MADIIDELLGMDDAALTAKLGFADRVKSFKMDLERASKLTGDGRTDVASSLTKMFVPSTYAADDLGWKVDRAEKKAKGKLTPTDLVNECGCCDPIDCD